MAYQGIDYGRGQTNIDHKTGIRYGVISIHEVTQAWCDSSEPFYLVHSNEYIAEQGNDDHDIFIIKSPYYTLCQFCSPCAPGAGYLMNHTPDGIKAYCFGHDWFDGERAPYPVYSVKTGKLVEPKR